MEFIFNQIWKERKMNLLAEGSLQGPAVGEFGGRQSAVKLQEFSAAPIAPSRAASSGVINCPRAGLLMQLISAA